MKTGVLNSYEEADTVMALRNMVTNVGRVISDTKPPAKKAKIK